MTLVQTLAVQSPLALGLCGGALAVIARLTFGRGAIAWAMTSALAAVAVALCAPAWGWIVDLAICLVLGVAALVWPRGRTRASLTGNEEAAPPSIATPPSILLGRTARAVDTPEGFEIWLDGRSWPARLEGSPCGADPRVRVIRIGQDGALVVGPMAPAPLAQTPRAA